MESSEFQVEVADGTVTCILAVPDGPMAAVPALLFTFAMTRQAALGEDPYDLPARVFLAAGHPVLSFDVPNHGERTDRYGSGIEGFYAAVQAGQDPFERFVADGRAVIDACVRRSVPGVERLVACGVSRTAYLALRLAAADERVRGVAGLAPVTDWRSLHEFASAKDQPDVAALSLDHWAALLAGRPVFLAIGNCDNRVGTDGCVRLALRIYEEEQRRGLASSRVECHVAPAEGHSLDDVWRRAGGEFLIRLGSEGVGGSA